MGESLIVVFGGSGYLGSYIVRSLLAAGYRVRVVARDPDFVAPPEFASRIENQPADIRDEAEVLRALQGAQGAVNAVSLYVEKPSLTFQAIHVDGAEHLARGCIEAGVPTLVHISGINSDPQSRSAYVSARGRGEERVREIFPEAIILRPSVMFGEGKGLLVTLESLCKSPFVPLFGRGQTRLQPVHVEDIARAVVAVIRTPDRPEKIYELGGGQVLSYKELVRVVLHRCHRDRPMVPVPFALWHIGAALLSPMKSSPLTRDQLVLMEQDNVAHEGVPGFKDLGLRPRRVEEPSLPSGIPADEKLGG